MSPKYPTRPEQIQAVRDAIAALDGNDAAIVSQAVALLAADGFTLGPGDKTKLRRYAEELNGKP